MPDIQPEMMMTAKNVDTGPRLAGEVLARAYDAVVVGAGFAGMYMIHKLRGLGLSVIAFEAAPDVGGVWYWNNYPGARCDAESLVYSYTFSDELQRDWHWPERFSAQPDILAYARHVADRFNIRRDIAFSTRVTSADWQEGSRRWLVGTDQNDAVTARYLIAAVGNLSATQLPKIPGIETFDGERYHTGEWPQTAIDFAGKDVVLIGTGSSGVQAVPVIAAACGTLTVLQRTANYSVPARNTKMRPATESDFKRNLQEYRKLAMTAGLGYVRLNPNPGSQHTKAERQAEFHKRWDLGGPLFCAAFPDMMTNPEVNAEAAEFLRDRIREAIDDSVTAELLVPKNLPVGAKRICVDTGYYETFNLPHVSLIDVRQDPVAEIERDAIRLKSGRRLRADIIVFATGYDAMTGSLLRLNITGAGGENLAQKWAGGPVNYLGIATSSFPNFFFITGPGSPSVLGNVVLHIEQHVDWLSALLDDAERSGRTVIEVQPDSEKAWVDKVHQMAKGTLFFHTDSWYLGTNTPGKPRVFMPFVGGLAAFVKICEDVRQHDYEGFSLTAE